MGSLSDDVPESLLDSLDFISLHVSEQPTPWKMTRVPLPGDDVSSVYTTLVTMIILSVVWFAVPMMMPSQSPLLPLKVPNHIKDRSYPVLVPGWCRAGAWALANAGNDILMMKV